MNRKLLPLLLMLSAGAVTCVINLVRGYPLVQQLATLLGVLVVFYILGSVLQWTLDLFDRQNEAKLADEGEVIEKDSELSEEEMQDGQDLQEAQAR
ncbi:MAG: hypothetical protein NC079_01435 [Clostridium sp.]|nr:hypothetical protein [Acetatifactor muris]MCM1525989.1 hypothetical protein [Bacteroides sp.]MCM1562251.1 hypothetical protein [Clostridium sp.]